MADLVADAQALEDHGHLHERIARFYREVADRVQSYGQPILHELRSKNHDDDASQYQQWLNPSNLQQLEDSARTHDDWAVYFLELAKEIRAKEDALSGNYPSSNGRGVGVGVR